MKKLFLLLGCLVMAASMSATTYKAQVYKHGTGAFWVVEDSLPYAGTDSLYEFTVQIPKDKSTITLLNWTGTTGDDVTFSGIVDGVVNTVNGVALPDDSGYNSVWVNTGGFSNSGYYGTYVYGGTTTSGNIRNKVTFNADGSGEGFFAIMDCWNNNKNRVVYYKWSTDTVAEVTTTTYPLLVKNDSIGTDAAFTALPYNENGEFLTTVSVASDCSFITINNWTAEADGSGESMKIYPSTEDGSVSIINGNAEGCYMGLGSQMDGTFDYTYAYADSYGYIEFDAEDGSEGEGYIYLWQYSLDQIATYHFSWPGKLSPLGIETVKNSSNGSDSSMMYNLAGQRVGANAKGVFIQNGKKYIK